MGIRGSTLALIGAILVGMVAAIAAGAILMISVSNAANGQPIPRNEMCNVRSSNFGPSSTDYIHRWSNRSFHPCQEQSR